MAGSFHDDWEEEGYFKNISTYEHDALCRKLFIERCNGNIGEIPDELEHPAWSVIKDSISETLSLWQVALIYYPFRDKVNTDHPLAFNFKNKRRFVLFDLLDAIYSGDLKVRFLPSEIESFLHFKRATLDHQIKSEIHVDDLAEAIRNFKVSSVYSKLVKQWRLLSAKRRQPTLDFMDAPETQRVKGYFSYPFAWLRPDEHGKLKDCIEDIPFSMSFPHPPEVRIMDTRNEWLQHRHPPYIYDLSPEEMSRYHWFQEKCSEINHDLHKGILSYPLLEIPKYLHNTPDGLPFAWQLKKPQRAQRTPGKLIEAAYRLYRAKNGCNPTQEVEIFNLMTTDNFPLIVLSRTDSANSTDVILELASDVSKASSIMWTYQKYLVNLSQKLIEPLRGNS